MPQVMLDSPQAAAGPYDSLRRFLDRACLALAQDQREDFRYYATSAKAALSVLDNGLDYHRGMPALAFHHVYLCMLALIDRALAGRDAADGLQYCRDLAEDLHRAWLEAGGRA